MLQQTLRLVRVDVDVQTLGFSLLFHDVVENVDTGETVTIIGNRRILRTPLDDVTDDPPTVQTLATALWTDAVKAAERARRKKQAEKQPKIAVDSLTEPG